LSECRSWTASKANLEPPRTTTLFVDGAVRSGRLAARSRVCFIGGVRLSLGKEGRFGIEVRPVAMVSFLQVKRVSDSVMMVQVFSTFVIFLTWLLNIIRSRSALPENDLCVEKASK